MTGTKLLHWLGLAVLFAIGLLLAAFHGFVGANKAFASLAVLAEHHAWTIHLPETLGRGIGWLELALTAALLAALVRPGLTRLGLFALGAFVVLEAISSWVHHSNAEDAALPQNAVSVALTLAAMALMAWRRRAVRA